MDKKTLKQELFEKLKGIRDEFGELTSDKKDRANMLLYTVEEIVSQFNKGKFVDGLQDLDLDEEGLNRLKGIVDNIWEIAGKKKLEIRPKPDITFKIG